MKYVDVVIDNNTDATDLLYTYACESDDIEVGRKVYVSFGLHNRQAEAYVISVSDEKPENIKKIKSVQSVDTRICLTGEEVRTVLWMHTRYLCRYIEAIKCFLPVSEAKRKTKDPFADIELKDEDKAAKVLNDEQADALESICSPINENRHEVFLLHGVTGSGKTEVYLQAMQRVIDAGKQGIILVPEISLTPQLVSRFMARFGKEKVAVLHSRLTPVQRTVEYKKIENGEVDLVIGARSAIFAPFKNIGLIVLDEEHESSYKSDKSPKYDAIEVAVKRAMEHKAVVILGSATPSVCDYYRSENGVFSRIELKNRYNQNALPSCEIIDMTSEIKAGNRSLFSRRLAEEMQDSLDNKKQIILFLNRRGYSSFVSCRECGYVVKCPECGIAMPYHKDDRACECHYCGRKVSVPKICPKCGSKMIGGFGAGTQQLEEKCAELFPDAAIERLDLDSVRKKGELEATLKRFEKKKTDILIGTQIVAKGLDFANVGLVGIISADVTLNIPDFRSSERTFQLVTQAAGRSGRGDEPGKVIIQSYNPESSALQTAARQDFEAFYDEEISIRRAASYPPFSDIYQIIIEDENQEKALVYAKHCADWLRKSLSEDMSVLGPAPPMLQKQSGLYRYQLLIKSPYGNRQLVSSVVRELKDKHEHIRNSAKLLIVDINPFTFI